jgi:hypothetical protein
MKKSFSFNKFRIKKGNNNLNFINAFKNEKINNFVRFNSFLKEKGTKLQPLNLNNNKKISKKLCFSKLETKFPNQNILKIEKKSKFENNNNNNNLNHKKKQKIIIPINKGNQCQNINQNFIININNNNINNSYQIKMNNNSPPKKPENNNIFNFSKIKIINNDDNNKNVNVSKSNYSEISEISCFYSNKKSANLNSINSFVNNDFDIFSISEESENQKNIEINQLKKGNKINCMNEIKKIYINPSEFEKFCREINEKLKI